MDLAAILVSQYQASLKMLKQAIDACPDSLWNASGDRNKFWQVAYHAIYFVHEYLAFCQTHVAERVPRLKLDTPEGHGRDMTTMELQIYSIRHLMQHTGELMERLAAHTDARIDWVGYSRPEHPDL
jgi:hypothetical protein